jgi:hypothetical protein
MSDSAKSNGGNVIVSRSNLSVECRGVRAEGKEFLEERTPGWERAW